MRKFTQITYGANYVDWSQVHPELANMSDPANKRPAQQLDEALERAKIDNELLKV